MIISKEMPTPTMSGQYLVLAKTCGNIENHLAYYEKNKGWDLAENPNSKRQLVDCIAGPFDTPKS